MYHVNEVFYTLQGEGFHAGRTAVFCRFAGCNLWSGREEDRASAICKFCDTSFRGTGPDGGVFPTAEALADHIERTWESVIPDWRFVVFTGGEPLLQLDEELIYAVRNRGFYVAVETNGTLPVPYGVDWICVSPKSGTVLKQRSGDELKLVYPQPELSPRDLPDVSFTHQFLQPMYGPDYDANLRQAVVYCQQHPQWRLSLQTHKLIGIR